MNNPETLTTLGT